MPIDLTRARAELRRQALLEGLYVVWPKSLGTGQLVDGVPDDVATTVDDAAVDLHYLQDGELITVQTHHSRSVDILRLTAAGVDAVESARDFGVTRSRGLRMLRLRVLQALKWAAPGVARPVLLARALEDDTDLDLSTPSVERALAYLCEQQLAKESDGFYRITRAGIDYLEADQETAEQVLGVATPLPPSAR